MSFKEDLITLKKINKGTIVIVQNGIFYIAIGNDAILLNKVLGLKCTCFARGICKVGFPIKSLRKYTTKLKEANYKYVVYDNKSEDAFEIVDFNDNNSIENIEIECNKDCIKCTKNKLYNFM